MSIAGGATGIFPYVFIGGTHFVGWGARGQTTTYDYNAAVRENGALSSKYYAAQNVGNFIKQYGAQLIHSRGGVCTFDNAPEEVMGALRVAADGTRFVFIHNNSPEHSYGGSAMVKPGKSKDGRPMYNIDQDENKVLINGQNNADTAMSSVSGFTIRYKLAPMETKVLIIPPHTEPEKGRWWFYQKTVVKPQQPVSFRFKAVKKYDETADGIWHPLPDGKSLPEMGINDARYVRYRSAFYIDASD
ncbi:conserved hypothetical protein, partial [Ricinus communis]